MFRRARLRLTLIYIALMGVTLAVVAGGIIVLGAWQTWRTEDLSLRLRAESLAAGVARSGGRPQPEQQHPRDGDGPPRLEQEGILSYYVRVDANVAQGPPPGWISGLPDVAAAQRALDAGAGRFQTVSLDAGQVRLYSLPVYRNGQATTVVQVAHSRYFVDASVTRLLLIVAGVGSAGLLLSSGASFWLAGRTLRPIAAALQRQRDFTADASHELRTPLALVRGNAELLQRHPDERIGAYEDVVQDIVDEVDRLGRLVSDLLTLARADSGQVQIAREWVDLSDLCDALVRELEPLAREKGLTLTGEIAPGVSVWGDANRLRQLGVILLDNAIRYTASGSVSLRLVRESHAVLLRVRDTGQGIAPEHLPHIFERFYRTDPARTTEQGGAGLGLAIAEWIADAHGGRIGVSSAVNHGSTFTVTLPRATASHHAPERADEPGSRDQSLPGTSQTATDRP